MVAFALPPQTLNRNRTQGKGKCGFTHRIGVAVPPTHEDETTHCPRILPSQFMDVDVVGVALFRKARKTLFITDRVHDY